MKKARRPISRGPSAAALRNLRTIPGVGPALARDLMRVGMRSVSCLRGENPERLYRRLEAAKGAHVDRCVLYVFRCAVYFAETSKPQARLLKWWNWSDANLARGAGRK